VPIRSFRFPIRAGRFAASAATLGLTLSAAAAQPRFPVPPPALEEPAGPVDGYPLPGDDVPRGVVPVEPIPSEVPSLAPPQQFIPPHDAAAAPPNDLAPPHGPFGHGPPPGDVPPAGPPRGHGPLDGSPHDFPHDLQPIPEGFVPPRFEPGRGPFAPPSPGPMSGPPSGWMPPAPEWSPPGPVGPMRPGAPLAPLPPVEADPSLGPPPGTLGHTYYRPSRYIPHDEQPRVAMLEVTLPPELAGDQGEGTKVRVTVHDVAGQSAPLDGYFGDDRHWHFESDPLLPGLPHVYRVKVERVRTSKEEIRRYGRLVEQEKEIGADLLGVRFLRLIPGRIVTLEF